MGQDRQTVVASRYIRVYDSPIGAAAVPSTKEKIVGTANKIWNAVVKKACAMVRGEYQKAVISGRQTWSGSDLLGLAKKYGSKYNASRERAFAALRAAGGAVIAVEHGRLVTAVKVCVDEYGNEVYATRRRFVRPTTPKQCRPL